MASITSTLVVALTMRDTVCVRARPPDVLFFLLCFFLLLLQNPLLFTCSIQLTTGQFFIFCLFAELVHSQASISTPGSGG